jgi:hypothetical protein
LGDRVFDRLAAGAFPDYANRFQPTATGAHLPCGRLFAPAMGSPVAILILVYRFAQPGKTIHNWLRTKEYT